MHLPTSCAIQIFGDRVDARFGVDVDLDDGRGVGVRGRGADAGAAIAARGRRRRVGADGAERPELRLRERRRPRRTRGPFSGVLDVEDAALGEGDPRGRDAELLGDGGDEQLARALGGLEGGVAGHERHARRIGAEVDGRQVRVRRDDADVERIDPEHLRDDVREDRVAPLPDVRRAAEDGDAAAAVELQLHSRLRHRVPVDREPAPQM